MYGSWQNVVVDLPAQISYHLGNEGDQMSRYAKRDVKSVTLYCPVCGSGKLDTVKEHVVCRACGSHSDISFTILSVGIVKIWIKENLKMFKE